MKSVREKREWGEGAVVKSEGRLKRKKEWVVRVRQSLFKVL